MADNLKNRGVQDQIRINLNQTHEVKYWTKELECTEEELRAAIGKAGTSAQAVRRALKGSNGKNAARS